MQNNEQTFQENAMFDMRRTGAIISALRRKANLTQAGLAEKLGISYQAVSSWERGASMPDISKLTDLARTLNTTVDYLLSGEEAAPVQIGEPAVSPIADEAAAPAEQKSDTLHSPDASPQPLKEQDKQTSPAKIEIKMPNKGAGLSSLVALAPFLDQETLDQAALEMEPEGDLALLCGLAPFLSSSTLDNLALREEGRPVTMSVLSCLAPFLSSETLEKLAERCDVCEDTALLSALAPFLPKEAVERLFARCRQAVHAGKEEERPEEKQKQGKAVHLTAKNIDALLANMDEDDLPQSAAPLISAMSEDQILKLISRSDGENVSEWIPLLSGRLTAPVCAALIGACDSEEIPALAKALLPLLDYGTADKTIPLLIDQCDSEEIPELAKKLSGRMTEAIATALIAACDPDCIVDLAEALRVKTDPGVSEDILFMLISRCDSDEITDLAELLSGRMTEAAASALIAACDPDCILDLAQILEPRAGEETIQRLIERCPGDEMADLIEILSPHLNPQQAKRIIQRIRQNAENK